jgi:hypothetical protein
MSLEPHQRLALGALAWLLAACAPATESDPLPSWNDGAAKTNILTFVQQVTDSTNAGFVSDLGAHRGV